MEQGQELKQGEFSTIAIRVRAIQFKEEMGPVFGVQMKTKKHDLNPSEFFIKTRFREPSGKFKEAPVKSGDWIVQFPDGAYEVVEDAQFHALYMELKGVPVPPAGLTEAPPPPPEPEKEPGSDVPAARKKPKAPKK